jgi:hypothetical protein
MRIIKLGQPPRGRQRVREVAAALGVPVSDVLAALAAIGEFTRGPASYIEPPVIRKVHEHYGVKYDSDVFTPPAPQAPVPLTGLAPPTPRSRRENNPLVAEPSLGPRMSDRPRAGSEPGVWTARSVDQEWARGAAGDASPAFEFEEWKLLGLGDVERDVWIAEGLRAGQARWAADLRDAGFTPQDLGVKLHGWTVIDRLRRGEGAKAVARLLRETRTLEAK